MKNPRKEQVGPGKGMPSCDICGGKGTRIVDGADGFPETKACKCVVRYQLYMNMRFTWRLLEQSRSPKETPLTDLVVMHQNARIVATQKTLASHLKCCMFSQIYYKMPPNPYWWVEVKSDKDIVAAWLYTAKLHGDEIHDVDVFLSDIGEDDKSIRHLALGPDLLIVQLGKKLSANKETSTTLIEALEYRLDRALLTWIVTHPDEPLEEGSLLAYSDKLLRVMEDHDFSTLILDKKGDGSEVGIEHRGYGVTDASLASKKRPVMSKGSVGKKEVTNLTKKDKETEQNKKKKKKKKKKGKSS